MLQTDLAWAYGLGSSFAVVAHTHLAEKASTRVSDGYLSWPFLNLVGVMTVLIVPCTAHMLWAFPEWQTMQTMSAAMSAWLMPASLVLILGLAVLGFAISLDLIRRKRLYLAYLQFMGGYFLMLFGVMYGWDGTGYRRLFSLTKEQLTNWSWSHATTWAESDIASAFNIYISLILPVLFYLASYWIKRDRPQKVSQWNIAGKLAVAIFGIVLTGALLSTLALIHLGGVWGGLVTVLVLVVMAQPRWGLLGRMYQPIFGPM